MGRRLTSNAVFDGNAIKGYMKQNNIGLEDTSIRMGYSRTWLGNMLKRNTMNLSQYKFLCLTIGAKEEQFTTVQESAPKEKPNAVSNDEMIRVLREIERNQREMLKAINLIKLDVATMRFAGEERDKTIGYIHKILGDFVDLFEDEGKKKK